MPKLKCQVCSENEHKYKCPACEVKYCSVVCYKNHKDGCLPKHGNPPDADKNQSKSENAHVRKEPGKWLTSENGGQEDKVPLTSLQRLENSEALKSMLENPHLRNMLTSLDASKTTAADIASAMQIPIFTEFADSCLSIVEPQNPPNNLIIKNMNSET